MLRSGPRDRDRDAKIGTERQRPRRLERDRETKTLRAGQRDRERDAKIRTERQTQRR